MPLSGLTETLERATATYQRQLSEALTGHRGPIGDYLRSRALDQPSTIDTFRLGYVAEPLPGDDAFRGRLAIPYLTPAGVRAIKYRCTEPHDCKAARHAKYAQPTGQRQRLYNVAAYHTGSDVLGVAEGELDALSASVHLGLPTLGVPGASQWQSSGKFWKLALADFGRVVIFADGDTPGLELAKQIAADAPNGAACIVQLPDGQDINSMVTADRIQELRQRAGI